ncbi:hypothetical protein RhiirA4_462179 [Rhizophagus irregularis]|uniref:Uncharacterized protein n=1 Tax=Rhizophagus irregularis TaxID=588596 RepID=A0A2I1GKF5_9GLOM|nr:hypothetical protein RhiirA4_462179 [Rhizophagus irregularis]
MINLAKERKYVIQQAKDKVFSMCENLKKEKVTDKQLLYLINMVIIPRIEYHTQLTFLSKQDLSDMIEIVHNATTGGFNTAQTIYGLSGNSAVLF